MRGTFSEDALLKFSELVSILDTADFSEAETYDFTRCIRPDGSAYGTGGKCRKGTEGESKNRDREAAVDRISKEKGISSSKAGAEADKIRMKELDDEIKSLQSMADKSRENGFNSRAIDYSKRASKLIQERADLRTKLETAAAKEKRANPNKEKIKKARTTYTDALNRELASYNTNDKAAIAKAKAESKEAFQAYKKEYDKGRRELDAKGKGK
jgi:hypothetical protein